MYTDAGMDTGDMLLKAEIEISDDMTAGELHEQACLSWSGVLRETLKRLRTVLSRGFPAPRASYICAYVDKTVGCINWSKSARDVHNLVRGTNPWPVAFTYYKGQK